MNVTEKKFIFHTPEKALETRKQIVAEQIEAVINRVTLKIFKLGLASYKATTESLKNIYLSYVKLNQDQLAFINKERTLPFFRYIVDMVNVRLNTFPSQIHASFYRAIRKTSNTKARFSLIERITFMYIKLLMQSIDKVHPSMIDTINQGKF